MINQPWVCPKCGRVYGPSWPVCNVCNNKISKEEEQRKKYIPPHPYGGVKTTCQIDGTYWNLISQYGE